MTDPLWMYKLKNGLLGTPENYGGAVDEQTGQRSQNAGLMNFGAALLAASGPSRTPTSFGQALGPAILQGRQAQQQGQSEALQSLLLKQQLAEKARLSKGDLVPVMEGGKIVYKNASEASGTEVGFNPNANDAKPSALVEQFNLARTQGFKGGIIDFANALGQANVGAQYTPTEIGGQRGAFSRVSGEFSPQSTVAQEAQAGAAIEGAKAGATAEARASAELDALMNKKAKDADSALFLLDAADPLIDAATGSLGGATADKLAAVFGEAPTGAQAIGKLKVIQAGLMLSMPRMEGPQSDKDTMLYREAAGQIGDPNVPREIKKAAVQTIRSIQDRHKNNGQPQTWEAGGYLYRVDPATGKTQRKKK